MGGVGLGGDHDAGGLLVDAVDDAGPRHSADPRQARPAVGQQGVDQGAGLAAGRRVHRHARRLVDHDQVGVLVEHGKRNSLGLGIGRRGRRDGDLVVAGPGLGGGVGQDGAGAGHAALGHQGLQPCARQVGDGLGQGLVEPPARGLGGQGDTEGFAGGRRLILVAVEGLAHRFSVVSR